MLNSLYFRCGLPFSLVPRRFRCSPLLPLLLPVAMAPRAAVLALVALVVLAFVCGADALCTCKKKTVPVGPCSVKLDVCGCVHHLKWRYKCSADASPGGGHYSYQWTKSGDGAAKSALVGLFQSMQDQGMCNCGTGTAPLGTCSIPFRACFYFANEAGLNAQTPVYKSFVTAPNGAVSQSSGQSSAQLSVEAAMTAMVTANPAIAAQCQAAANGQLEAFEVKNLL